VKTKQFKSSDGIVAAIANALRTGFSSEVLPQQQRLAVLTIQRFQRLQGTLTKVFKYGKPSYGAEPETDEKVEVPILILQTPVRSRPDRLAALTTNPSPMFHFVQLIFPPEIDENYQNISTKISSWRERS